MANTELIEKTLAAIEAEPHRWDMGNWIDSQKEPCNTIMCFAGHAIIQSGTAELVVFKEVHNDCDTNEEFPVDVTGFRRISDGTKIEEWEIPSAARELLELTYDDAHEIFFATEIRTPGNLRQHVENVLEERSRFYVE